jgi:hypothetical protein
MVQTWSASGARLQGNLRLACIKRLLIYVEGSSRIVLHSIQPTQDSPHLTSSHIATWRGQRAKFKGVCVSKPFLRKSNALQQKRLCAKHLCVKGPVLQV